MTYLEAQFQLTLARISRTHAEIVSGAYRFRETKQCVESTDPSLGNYRDCTDDEKLRFAMQTMESHLRFAESLVERLFYHGLGDAVSNK